MKSVLLEFVDVSKDYGGLRPLRIARLSVETGDEIALVGIDQPAAETLVHLVTGALLPDTGTVRTFGRPTAAIGDGEDWLRVVDRVGILTERAVLLDAFTVLQNLAMPFTLAVDPMPEGVRTKVEALAREVDLKPDFDEQRVGDLDQLLRARVRLARALALDPSVLLLEHPTTTVSRNEARVLGRQIRRVARGRRLATVSVTADRQFASAVARRVLQLNPASGTTTEQRRRWFQPRPRG